MSTSDMPNQNPQWYIDEDFGRISDLIIKIKQLRQDALVAGLSILYAFAKVSSAESLANAKGVVDEYLESLNKARTEVRDLALQRPLPPVMQEKYDKVDAVCASVESITDLFLNKYPFTSQQEVFNRLLLSDVSASRDARRKENKHTHGRYYLKDEVAEALLLAVRDDDYFAMLLRLIAPLAFEDGIDTKFLWLVESAYSLDYLHPAYIAALIFALKPLGKNTLDTTILEEQLWQNTDEGFDDKVIAQINKEKQEAEKESPILTLSDFYDKFYVLEDRVSSDGYVALTISIPEAASFVAAKECCDKNLRLMLVTSLQLEKIYEVAKNAPKETLIYRAIGEIASLKEELISYITAVPVARKANFFNQKEYLEKLCSSDAFFLCTEKNAKEQPQMREKASSAGVDFALFKEDELYRNLFFIVHWHSLCAYDLCFNGDLDSLITELYRDAHLSPQAILTIFALIDEEAEIKEESEDDSDVDIEQFRRKGWSLAADQKAQFEFNIVNREAFDAFLLQEPTF